jgi:hypothetical protein
VKNRKYWLPSIANHNKYCHSAINLQKNVKTDEFNIKTRHKTTFFKWPSNVMFATV